jgi:class I fructose-bisphosphate aldolase
VESAGRVPVLVSGGSKISDEDLLAKAEDCLEAGVVGLIFGRNMWQRPFNEALAMTGRIQELMARYGR